MGSVVSSIAGPVLGFLGAEKEANAQYDAAKYSSDAQLRAAQIAAEQAKFRPVGITNRFGSSNFGFDSSGNLTSAGYTLSPELQAYQDYLSKQTQAGLGDTSRLLSLGRSYIGEDPAAVRQRYISQQQALLAPENEQALASIRNKLFQTGRQGLATGATTAGGMAATNPELAAYYNALAKQNAALAAGAEQAAQQQVTYGQGLLSSAYSPFQTSLGLMGSVENLGMQPLTIGSELGGRSLQGSQAASNALLQGGLSAAKSMQSGMGYSPWGSLLSGMSQNKQFTQGIGNLFSNSPWTGGYNTPTYGYNTPGSDAFVGPMPQSTSTWDTGNINGLY